SFLPPSILSINSVIVVVAITILDFIGVLTWTSSGFLRLAQMDKSIILIVPGGFTMPDLYSDVITHVASKEYSIQALHLPSVGYKTNVPGTMQDDAAFIASEISKHADEGKDVVHVAHSYGGLPATESTKGLSKVDRQRQGKSGGLFRLAYISCIILPVGESDTSVIMPDNMLPRAAPFEIRVDLKGSIGRWMVTSNRYLDCCILCLQRSAERRGRKVGKAEYSSFGIHVSCWSESCRVQRCAGVIFTDLTQEPELQRASIAMMERQGGKVDVTEIQAGHAPNASRSEEVANWITFIAEQSG
ncbi:hypothetical protein F1880_002125, partial [Penicillium rolfsii]